MRVGRKRAIVTTPCPGVKLGELAPTPWDGGLELFRCLDLYY